MVAHHTCLINGYTRTSSQMKPVQFIKEEAGQTVLDVVPCRCAEIVKLARHVSFQTSIISIKLRSMVLLKEKRT